MRRNDCYMLKKISNVTYILPFGQMIADHRRGIQVNDTGAFIWQSLEKDISAEELADLVVERFQVPGEDLLSVRKDINRFLSDLYALGMINPPEKNDFHFNGSGMTLRIAGLKVRLWGPSECFSRNFDAFAVQKASCRDDADCGDESEADQTILIASGAPLLRENGSVLIRTPELTVMELDRKYIFLFPQTPQILEASMSKDGKIVKFHCIPPFDDEFREKLFHAVRLCFLYLTQLHGMAAIHSASILYRGRAWLFSGPSGTGKSTHTNLWHDMLNVPLINGDLNLIAVKDHVPTVPGIPWCGTSGIFDASEHPLGGILLLSQAPCDRIEELTDDKKRLLISQRFISPFWSEEMMNSNLALADRLSENILICRLHCTPKRTAVDTAKAEIDTYLSRTS